MVVIKFMETDMVHGPTETTKEKAGKVVDMVWGVAEIGWIDLINQSKNLRRTIL